MTVFKTFKFRIYPTAIQKAQLSQRLDCMDQEFNKLSVFVNALAEQQTEETVIRANIRTYPLSKTLAEEEAETVRQTVYSLLPGLVHGSIIRILPRFANREHRSISYKTLPLSGQYIWIPCMGWVEVNLHRELPSTGRVYQIDVCETCHQAEYHVSFHLVYELAEAVALVKPPVRVLGLDYKQDGLYMDSDGQNGGYPGFYAQRKDEIRELRRKALRFKTGSSRWKKMIQRADRLERHVRNQRADWQYKRAAELAKNYDAVCHETLNFFGMKENDQRLAAKIKDNNWTAFEQKLRSKLKSQGKQLIAVSQYYPSSQICSVCGFRFGKMPISQTDICCPCCRTVLNRDINAARNIRDEGMRLLHAA